MLGLVLSSGRRSPREATSKDEIVIRDLGSAILQLEQSIEPKFLKRPLGSSKLKCVICTCHD